MRIITIIFSTLLAVAVIVTGCSSVMAPAPGENAVEAESMSASEQNVRQQLEAHLAKSDLLAAYRVLREVRGSQALERSLADVSAELVSKLLRKAQQEESASHYASAGHFYRMALNVFPVGEEERSSLTLNREGFNDRLAKCADMLMNEGLAVYRAGDLMAAIDIWKKIRDFQPDHGPSEVAISTAEKQLETLEMLTPEEGM